MLVDATRFWCAKLSGRSYRAKTDACVSLPEIRVEYLKKSRTQVQSNVKEHTHTDKLYNKNTAEMACGRCVAGLCGRFVLPNSHGRTKDDSDSPTRMTRQPTTTTKTLLLRRRA